MNSARFAKRPAAVWLGFVLVCGPSAGQAQVPVQPVLPRPAAAVPAPVPPTPAQLAVSLAGLRKETRRQAAQLRAAHAQFRHLEKSAAEAASLREVVGAQQRRLDFLDSTFTWVIAALLLMALFLAIAFVAIFRAARPESLDEDLHPVTTAPAKVRRGLREMEERLRLLEADEKFPHRVLTTASTGANGEGAAASYRE